jgi:maltose alpha-D-glucosyltransferase / alpha-amylase
VTTVRQRTREKPAPATLEEEPLWYREAVIYQLHVKAFHDSDGDGIGDFPGLTQKLDYLQDLGVTAIWLLPFYPSPLKDDGYDIADYTDVHPSYGTLRDFQVFLREAHRRGLRIITELVMNHTSDRHRWFERARRAPPGSRWRDFYVWSDTPERYREARIIFQDFESSNWAWDPVAKAYYWHRFYSHQPDLNFDSPHVRRAMLQVVDFWLGMGVDGLRLDAVPYLYEREGTSCENLPETHEFLRELRAHTDRKYRDRMLLAEANQWPDDACEYFADGDECHMAFHFPLMPRLFMSIHQEDRFPVVDIMANTPDIPDNCQWAVFLRNHDELTLEMVTDEERDYMYRVYASDPQARINLGIRRRLAPLLGNNRRKIELMNGLLLSLPGTPVIYYGDEIGMGDNIYLGDRNGVRTPMQWSPDRNAGFSRANPQRLFQPVTIDPEYHYEALNVESQHNNQHSLLWWTKRLVGLRKRYQAFGRGSLEFLSPDNHKVLAFIRRYENETVLVVANLSRFVQAVELDLSEFNGARPVEMFGRTDFPSVGELPYFLTLGPHAFYWFSLEPQHAGETAAAADAPDLRLPQLTLRASDDGLFKGRTRGALEALLPEYMKERRWFGGKARSVRLVEVVDAIPIAESRKRPIAYVTIVRVSYRDGEPETYMLPLGIDDGELSDWILNDLPSMAVARLQTAVKTDGGLLFDAAADERFTSALLDAVVRRRRFKGMQGELAATPTRASGAAKAALSDRVAPTLIRAEQSNTSLIYGEHVILKLFRRVHEGANPDLEIGRFLTEKARFPHTPNVVGALEHRRKKGKPSTLGILFDYVPNEGDAWRYTLDALALFLERALTEPPGTEMAIPHRSLLDLAEGEIDPMASEMMGSYLASASLLGTRTAELHLALSSDADDPDFSPQPFTSMYQRSLHQSWRAITAQTFDMLRRGLRKLPPEVQGDARRVLDLEKEVYARYRAMLDHRISAARIRCHGDYHLGQVLYTGKDFVVIDFEGEPARPLGERRLKRSPLRDVAGMIRSFHYAAYTAVHGDASGSAVRPEDAVSLTPWARFWYIWTSVTFLKGYLETAEGAVFMPASREQLHVMLNAFLLEKAVYEMGYEMNNRPNWLVIPIHGVLELLEAETTTVDAENETEVG